MGNKGGKPAKKVSKKPSKLSSKDVTFLTKQTGMTKDQVTAFFKKFNENNPNGALDRPAFTRLYIELRPEPEDKINEIANYVFSAFDINNDGSISFTEFMLAYAMTSRGDQKDKLEYAFELYDADDSGTLDKGELKSVIYGMLGMLGADRKGHHVENLANECMSQLDSSGDGMISKDEFVSGLIKNYSLRALMSPFN